MASEEGPIPNQPQLLKRLDDLETLGLAVARRCQESCTTRVCLSELLPLLKQMYPDINLFEAQHAKPD